MKYMLQVLSKNNNIQIFLTGPPGEKGERGKRGPKGKNLIIFLLSSYCNIN